MRVLFAEQLEKNGNVVNVDNVNLTYRNILKMTKLSIFCSKLAGGPLYNSICCKSVKFENVKKVAAAG